MSRGAAKSGAVADADLARVVASWPQLPEATRRAVLALVAPAAPPTDFAAAFAAAFERLDRQAGGHNFLSLVDLRAALPDVTRAAYDAGLHALRLAGRYTLSSAEGRHGLTPAERAAGIREDGLTLLYVSRR